MRSCSGWQTGRTVECRWLVEEWARTVKPRTARAPIDVDPLGEFASEPPEIRSHERPHAISKLPSATDGATRRVGVWPLSALTLAIVQLPLVTLWLVGVPSPVLSSAGTSAPASPLIEPQAQTQTSAPPNFSAIPKVAHSVSLEGGVLEVATEPPGARVSVDGSVRGRSPLTLSDLSSGSHTVVARFGARAIERVVSLQPGQTLSLVVAAPDDVSASGSVTVESAIPLQVYRDGQFVGSSENGALLLPVGNHTLDIRDDRLGFRIQHAARVRAGATTPVRIELPRVAVSVDAQPWAEVWVDGTPVGMTPVSSLMLTIGRHMVRLRHPELGERSTTLLATLDEPVRLFVDLRSE